MIASKDLIHMAVRSAHANGLNDFRPELVDVDETWIQNTLDNYRFSISKNT